jgi:Uma2 family endonuclease
MNHPVRRTMSREDFLTWAEHQDGRYEYDGFQPVAMTGGTNAHGMISRNLHGQLYNLLRGRPCQALPSEGGAVATIDNKLRFPDAAVTCSPVVATDRLIPNPIIIFEVLSDTSTHNDTIVKKREYQAVPSIRRYILIDQTQIAVTTHWRPAEGPWMTDPPQGAGATLELPEIGIALAVADVYERVTFSP